MMCTVKEISTLKTETRNDGIKMSYKLKNKIYLYKKLIRTHETTAVWLTLWPCAWSVMLAAKDTSISFLQLAHCLFLMVASSFLMVSMSNIYNDVIDRDFDKKVKRCMDRPVASGALSASEALALLVPFLLLYTLLMMQVNGNGKVVMLGCLGLVLVYPFAKRITNYPAIVLGLAANNGIFLGWIVVRENVDWSVCIPLLVGAFFWTIVYDTIYGLQDAEDDARIGVKSMALSFGSRVRTLTAVASVLATLCFTVMGAAAEIAWPYYAALAVVLMHLLVQVFSVNIDDPKDCSAKYQSNQVLGLILLLGIIAGNWYSLAPWDEIISKMWSDDL